MSSRPRGVLDRNLLPFLGTVPLSKLGAADLDRFYRRLADKGGRSGRPLSASTIRRTHGILHRALVRSVRWGWLIQNPAASASPPRVPTPDIRPPSPAELARLFALAKETDADLADFILLAAAIGARRSELVALRCSDIDLDAGRLTVSRGIVSGPDGLVEKDTKTHASRRVSLDGTTIEALRTHRDRASARADELNLARHRPALGTDSANADPLRLDAPDVDAGEVCDPRSEPVVERPGVEQAHDGDGPPGTGDRQLQRRTRDIRAGARETLEGKDQSWPCMPVSTDGSTGTRKIAAPSTACSSSQCTTSCGVSASKMTCPAFLATKRPTYGRRMSARALPRASTSGRIVGSGKWATWRMEPVCPLMTISIPCLRSSLWNPVLPSNKSRGRCRSRSRITPPCGFI